MSDFVIIFHAVGMRDQSPLISTFRIYIQKVNIYFGGGGGGGSAERRGCILEKYKFINNISVFVVLPYTKILELIVE